jgi:glycosyltransferase involved in cell wall biosynthesis
MTRVLFITEDYPNGLNGTSVKTRNTLKFMLDHGFEVDLCCAELGQIENKIEHDNLRQFLVKKHLPNRFSIRYFIRALNLIFSPNPLIVQRLYDHRLGLLTDVLVEGNDYDYIFYDAFSTLVYHSSDSAQSIYIDDEDITDLLLQRYKSTSFGLRKLWLGLDVLKSKSYEEKYLKKMDQIWAISPDTKTRLKTLSSAETNLMPTFVPAKTNVYHRQSQDVVFTGTLSWAENIAGLKWFLENHWAKIHQARPDVKLKIIGREASDEFVEYLKSFPGIEFRGYVKDLRDVYQDCALAIAPVLINAGIKVKILTYWSYGLPVVATPTSALGLVSRQGLVLGDDQNFADKVISLLDSPRERDRLAQAGYNNIKNNYSLKQLNNFFKERLNV